MIRKLLYAVIAMFSMSLGAHAQADTDVLAVGQEYYNNGHFEEAERALKSGIATLEGNSLISAYRLLALTCLCLDKAEEAEVYVGKLLTINPYYTVYNDSPRLIDIIEKLKSGTNATIVTASQQAETIEEAPVPVTVITESMIHESGARNLMDLLVDYVPGVFRIEGTDPNFSMRSMYGYAQEAVLIMLNGVRLNSYNNSSFSPDYRISLANIKQVEVLRGPAASLYGNAALSAVVNIITRKGSDIDGVEATVGAGTCSTFRTDMLFGKRFLDIDLTVWGSLYSSNGYRHSFSGTDPVDMYGMLPKDGEILVDGYNKKPAYDLGLTMNWKNFSLQISRKYAKRTPPYCNLFLPAPYSYDKYTSIRNQKPGQGNTQTFATLRYAIRLGKWFLDAGLNLSNEDVTSYNVFGDDLPGFFDFGEILGAQDEYVQHLNFTSGGFMVQGWKTNTISADAKANFDYKTPIGKGNLLFGAQSSLYNMYYNDVILGDQFDRIAAAEVNDRVGILANNREDEWSLFGQVKQNMGQHLILNVGLRFDHKRRFTDETFNKLSPRIALSWMQNDRISYKLSYANAFVDVPYFYRVSKVVYPSNPNLSSESINSFQGTAIFKFPKLHLEYEANLFYNYIHNAMSIFVADQRAMNVDAIKVGGIENTLKYTTQGFKALLNMSAQYVFHADAPVGDGSHAMLNVPSFMAHLTASKRIFRDLWITVKPSFQSGYTTYTNVNAMRPGMLPVTEDLSQPAYFMLDAGVRYDWDKKVSVSVFAYNVLNQEYRLGGDRVPVLQPGTTLLGTLTYRFGK